MRAVFGDGAADYMRGQMRGWLSLSQQGLPSSLLLLSRALVLTTAPGAPAAGAAAPEEQLKGVRDTLLTLPEEVIQDVGLEVGPGADASGAAELQKRLELIQKEQAMIKQEAAAAKELEAKEKAAKEKAAAAAAAGQQQQAALPETALDAGEARAASDAAAADAAARGAEAARNAAAVAAASAVIREAAAGAVKAAMQRGADESLDAHATAAADEDDAAKGVSEEERAARAAAEKEKRMQDIISALAVLASSSGALCTLPCSRGAALRDRNGTLACLALQSSDTTSACLHALRVVTAGNPNAIQNTPPAATPPQNNVDDYQQTTNNTNAGVATERAAFMTLVRREVDRLQDALGPQAAAHLVFTGAGGLRAVRPEDGAAADAGALPELRAPLVGCCRGRGRAGGRAGACRGLVTEH